MHTVELYRKVRLACRDGMSERAAARQFGISRESVKNESVKKMLCFSVPPGYRRPAPVRRPKLDGFIEIIDQWLKEDLKQLRKQRHTGSTASEPCLAGPATSSSPHAAECSLWTATGWSPCGSPPPASLCADDGPRTPDTRSSDPGPSTPSGVECSPCAAGQVPCAAIWSCPSGSGIAPGWRAPDGAPRTAARSCPPGPPTPARSYAAGRPP